MDLLRITARVAGPTLDMARNSGYRDKALDALVDLEGEVLGWVSSHRPVSESVDVDRFLPNDVTTSVVKKFKVDQEIQGENVEHTLHEAEHALIDASFDLDGKRGGQTSKSKVDALLDEIVISSVTESADYNNKHRFAEVVEILAKDVDPSAPSLKALESLSSDHPVRQKAWRTALRRAGSAPEKEQVMAFVEALLDTLPLDRDPTGREVEERMRSFYAQLTARVERVRKEFKEFVRQTESQPGWKENRDRGRREYLDKERSRLREEGLSEEEINEYVTE